jgi:hypothetical protein
MRSAWSRSKLIEILVFATTESYHGVIRHPDLPHGASSIPRDLQSRIDEARAMKTEEVCEEMLATAGVDATDLATLLDLLAIGITNGVWRNSWVEDWHAEGRLSDGDMKQAADRTRPADLTCRRTPGCERAAPTSGDA